MKSIIAARTLRTFLATTAGILLLVAGCRKDPNLDRVEVEQPAGDISFTIPEGWPQPFYNFQNNALTAEGFELGRRLFFDTRLSRDNSTSCGSCHQPFSAFAQLDHPFSHGVDNQLGNRNSPPLFNLNWHTSFFWDGGVNHIESQPINPIQNPVEMDESLDNIIGKLNADAAYRARFKAAFGDEQINSQRIFKALAQFMGVLVSSNAKYDKYLRHEPGGEMTAQELDGLTVFNNNCASCHKPPLFTDFSFRNNGLAPSVSNDSGRAHITRDANDLYKFKVGSLRNLKYTHPYMHDGSLATLQAVLAHYTSNLTRPGTDPALQGGVALTAQQQADLLAFLNTLNDEEFVKDTRFLEPGP